MKKFLAVIVAVMTLMTTAVIAAPPLFDTPYIGNNYRKTFHRRDCESVRQMNRENQVPFRTREEAFAAGYSPCGNCKP